MSNDRVLGAGEVAVPGTGATAGDPLAGLKKVQELVREKLRARRGGRPPERQSRFDTPEGRAANWDELMHLMGYDDVPPELSGRALEEQYGAELELEIEWLNDEERFGADRSRVAAVLSFPIRCVLHFLRQPFDLPRRDD